MVSLWLKTIVLCYVVLVIVHGSLKFNDTWNEKVLEYEDKIREYEQHNCINVKTTNTLIKEECNRLYIIINTYPFIRAITKTVYSCFTISFRELIYKIAYNNEYRILFILVSFVVIYYIFIFSMISIDKFIEFKDRERTRITEEYIKQKL